ncbi:probable Ufm1-specific protease 1 [Drosophila subobscura]|uniref:probable Ufm1-specific protease 1 n=1 Tax=Drosophila subobscura TaxID=7241 RepID=UPI00155A84D7|nr:probable Ufm1-specific protease 1 [Drosophila subobscura]
MDTESAQQAPVGLSISPKTYTYALHEDPHRAVAPPTANGETLLTRGRFSYFHYGCDGHQDAGWGCGYRTLQTAISWLINKRSQAAQQVPSIREIQQILIELGDKPASFGGSRDWVGTLEEFYVIDALFQLPCKILHTKELCAEEVLQQIRNYFVEYAGFIPMGGLSDAASKGIAGWHGTPTGEVYLLIVDPHYAGVPESKQQLIDSGYVRWMHTSELQASAYNLCLMLQQ